MLVVPKSSPTIGPVTATGIDCGIAIDGGSVEEFVVVVVIEGDCGLVSVVGFFLFCL